jgi:hypothetical protein
MRISLSMICFLIGLLAMSTSGRSARGQDDRGELPETIRQLIRAADLAEQQVKREGGVVVNEEADQKARAAHRAARRAISDYYAAYFDYDRDLKETENLRRDAAEADSKLIAKGKEIPPNPRLLQDAQEDRDNKLRALAESEIKLASARQALANAGKPSGSTSGGSRPGVPPALPVPDYGTQRPGVGELVSPSITALYGCRYVYRNDEGSFHLANQSGTAYYTRFGQPHIVSLEAKPDTANFFWYRVVSGDGTIVEWAFAKNPEFPGLDWTPRYAVWCHDRAGWHWEWSYRDEVCDYLTPGATPTPVIPSTPTMPRSPLLLPGPATYFLPAVNQPIVLAAERP